ncbi:MAG: hypothetical protein IKR17_11455 [Bacteroidales bacterium]|nr:hypothetical protein [Bacteroidales bacterium]
MKKRIIIIASLVVAVALALTVFFRYYFVFGEGVKSGTLNYIVYKGVVFKTYEGKLIQSGFKSATNAKTGSAPGTSTAIQSYEFQFSVTDPHIADSLMLCSGRDVQLHYKEYISTLPWRGMSEYVVDSIISVR